MMNYGTSHKIVFYSLINGVGNSTIAYQLARLLRLHFYQEQKDDLVYYLKKILDPSRYTVKHFDEYERENQDKIEKNEAAVFDMKRIDKSLFNEASAIMVLTNNSRIDILKTIATLQKISDVLEDKSIPVFVIFNRLQMGNADREKKYTDVSKKLILQAIDELKIRFLYIRTSLVYYRNVNEGHFFMESFLKRNNAFFEQYKDDLQYIEHPVYLKMFYENLYHNKAYDFQPIFDGGEIFDELKEKIILDDDDQAQKRSYTRKNKNDKPINQKSSKEYKKKIYATQEDKINDWIVTQNLHQENIRFSKSAIHDMYLLLSALGVYEDKKEKKEKAKKQKYSDNPTKEERTK